MPKWLLPTLSEILALQDPTWAVQYASDAQDAVNGNGSRRSVVGQQTLQRVRAEREWTGAIAALSTMLRHAISPQPSDQLQPTCGLVLSGPLPVISHPDLITKVSTWSLTTNSLHTATWMPFRLLPSVDQQPEVVENSTTSALPLLPDDPLAGEQFCLVLTPWFSLVMVLGETLMGDPAFMFSFMPDVVQHAWEAIRPRILLMNAHQVEHLDSLTEKFPPIAPDYQTVMQFSRLMMENLPEPLEELRNDAAEIRQDAAKEVVSSTQDHAVPLTHSVSETSSPDVELLKALAHEIRTPLATIRTLTRSLLKRPDLSPDVLKRLNMIDRECSEQIDRFGLIFRAVELETSSTRHAAMSLTRTSLTQVFQESIPRWQKQASQRQLTLDVALPQKMPMVVSDPTMLDQALTSLIERFTRNLPAGSHIKVQVTPAGDQLKLQLESNPNELKVESSSFTAQAVHQPLLKAIGQLLMFQPETGSLSLNLSVTKNLFQALGGKLIVKQRPQQGEVMTVFLPLEMSSSNVVDV